MEERAGGIEVKAKEGGRSAIMKGRKGRWRDE